ncbi:hypothetical protein E2562_037405 [Oryza meyeriana var. granulata]|uniref:Uncharacterized protein n=1 Tax=Oryza meyeriana var. granulata TaxID=110450 RepID=A0A6G1ECV3_9ORYZ|nr:hypothetical protein E2562_037405 [Oryza meyeriana var. granulata]
MGFGEEFDYYSRFDSTGSVAIWGWEDGRERREEERERDCFASISLGRTIKLAGVHANSIK